MENKQFEEQQQNLRYEDWKQAEIELQNLQTLKRNSQTEYEAAAEKSAKMEWRYAKAGRKTGAMP